MLGPSRPHKTLKAEPGTTHRASESADERGLRAICAHHHLVGNVDLLCCFEGVVFRLLGVGYFGKPLVTPQRVQQVIHVSVCSGGVSVNMCEFALNVVKNLDFKHNKSNRR